MLHAQQTVENRVQVLTRYPTTTIDILSGNTVIPCSHSQIAVTITNGSRVGAGTSINAGNNFVYARAAGFVGRDTINCNVVCNGINYTINLYITVVECPDNIEEVECFRVPEGFEWAIREAWRSTEDDICVYQTPIIGDFSYILRALSHILNLAFEMSSLPSTSGL